MSRFLFTRYCAALADPCTKTQDGLANALRVAHRRVRASLEACFSDEDLDADLRRDLLIAYGALDERVEQFWTCLGVRDSKWLERGSDLIRQIEAAFLLAAPGRQRAAANQLGATVPAKPSSTMPAAQPGVPVELEDEETGVYERPVTPVARSYRNVGGTTPF